MATCQTGRAGRAQRAQATPKSELRFVASSQQMMIPPPGAPGSGFSDLGQRESQRLVRSGPFRRPRCENTDSGSSCIRGRMQEKRNPATTRLSNRREAPRAAGPKPVELRRPDTSSESFRSECERESLSLANDPNEAEVLDCIARVADVTGDWS